MKNLLIVTLAAMFAMCLSSEHTALRHNTLNSQLVRSNRSFPDSRNLASKGKGGKGGKYGKKGKGTKSLKGSKSPGKGSSKAPKSSKSPGKGGKGGKGVTKYQKGSKTPGKGGKGGKSSKSPGKGSKSGKSSKSPGKGGKGGKGSKGSKAPKKSNKVGKKGKKSETDDDLTPNEDDITPNPNAACDSPEGRKADILDITESISGSITDGSAQKKALNWLMDDTETNKCDGTKDITERYALATFYYSTNGGEWNNSDNWLTSAAISACASWFGVICDDEANVVAINLRKFKIDCL